MVRILATLCLACLAGAALIAFQPDPWVRAGQRAAQDAAGLSEHIDRPDKISWLLTRDHVLLRAVVWDGAGTRRYPPPDGMTPLPLKFSEEAIRDLASLRSGTATATWTPFDMAQSALLHCRPAPAVCLVYDRALLEEALGLRPDMLVTQRSRGGPAMVLTVIACFLAGAAIWLLRRPATDAMQGATPGFRIVPERHIAIRDTLEVALTPRDLKLLSVLQDRDGAVVTKDELYDAGWGREYMPNSRALDQHIINLRRKLDPDKSRPVLIETVRGVGYRMVL